MRQSACVGLVLNLLFAASAACSAPCTTAASSCTDWVTVGNGRTLVYRTQPLDTRNEAITRALVVVHGQGRNADGYFRSAVAAALLAGALDNTVVVSPRFASNQGNCHDKLDAQEINWVCIGGESWRNGGGAVGNAAVTSFDMGDAIVQRLVRKEVFPNLKRIVIAGHSAGGQYVGRYAMANQMHERAGVPVSYVVANPSSYTYPDALRPTVSAFPTNVAALPPGYTAPRPDKPPAAFAPFRDAANCTTYDTWPYGYNGRTGYSARVPPEQLTRQMVARPTTFMLGELDILPLYGFDSSCPAMAQGPTRLARGLAYVKHIGESYNAKHRAVVIPACGHNARCMLADERALPLLFPSD